MKIRTEHITSILIAALLNAALFVLIVDIASQGTDAVKTFAVLILAAATLAYWSALIGTIREDARQG